MDSIYRIVRRGERETLHVLGSELGFLCDAAHTGRAWSLMEVRLPRDAGPPPHHHDWAEAYYVLDGEVEFQLDDERVMLHAGDFLHAPAGQMHGFRGAGDADARLLVFDAPAHAGGFFREVDREVRTPDDGARVPEIAARHGIHFAPPELATAAG